jgi:hypothetical protein
MNRTVVDLVAAKPAGRAELADLGLHFLMQRLLTFPVCSPQN